MSEIAPVTPGDATDAIWANLVSPRVVSRYATEALRDADVNNQEGATCYVLDTDTFYIYDGGTWLAVANSALYDLSTVVDSKLATATQNGAWQNPNYLNGWVDFGSGQQTGSYRHEQNGRVVRLRGLIRAGLATPGQTIFVLDPGYRPPLAISFAIASGDGYGQIDIKTNGNVDFRAGLNTVFGLYSSWAIDS